MQTFVQVSVNGIAVGAIYGLVALGYTLTFATLKKFNFALGMWVMLGGMLSYSLLVTFQQHPIVALMAVALSMLVLGVVAERLTVHAYADSNRDAWIVTTLAFGLLIVDFSELIWGRNTLKVPSFVGDEILRFGELAIRLHSIVVVAFAAFFLIALHFFLHRTKVGVKFRAVSHDAEMCQILGINPRPIQIGSYAMACSIAGVAGFLIAPITDVDPYLGDSLGFKAFAIAIIAGLNSPMGVLLFGSYMEFLKVLSQVTSTQAYETYLGSLS